MKKSLVLAMFAFALAVSPEVLASGGKGMTWSKGTHANGVDLVTCNTCNAYVGDTACTASQPLLCIKTDGSSVPADISPDFYHGWARGNVATTPPILGSSMTSLAAADAICASNFGAGWRMAEFHDGSGGWGWYAYGNIRSDYRMWVYISDQPSNCWNP